MKIEAAVCNCVGGRKYSEDSVRVITQEGLCAAVVADGLGGHGGGQIASSIVVDTMVEAFPQGPQIGPEEIRHLFERANAQVVQAQSPAQQMKSTGVALFVRDGAAVWGHAGDSRLYRFANGALAEQTLDHSVSQMAVLTGEITQGEVRHHADRNRVLKAFGGEGFKADISCVYVLEPGFHAFLLCTDGFWEYVWETEMEIELAKAEEPIEWLSFMIGRLAGRVPRDHDNFSAAAVFIDMEGAGG